MKLFNEEIDIIKSTSFVEVKCRHNDPSEWMERVNIPLSEKLMSLGVDPEDMEIGKTLFIFHSRKGRLSKEEVLKKLDAALNQLRHYDLPFTEPVFSAKKGIEHDYDADEWGTKKYDGCPVQYDRESGRCYLVRPDTFDSSDVPIYCVQERTDWEKEHPNAKLFCGKAIVRETLERTIEIKNYMSEDDIRETIEDMISWIWNDDNTLKEVIEFYQHSQTANAEIIIEKER